MREICTFGLLDACTARTNGLPGSRATLARLAFHTCAARERAPFSEENAASDAEKRCFCVVFRLSVRWLKCPDFAIALYARRMNATCLENQHQPCRRSEKHDSRPPENAKCHFDISGTNCGTLAG